MIRINLLAVDRERFWAATTPSASARDMSAWLDGHPHLAERFAGAQRVTPVMTTSAATISPFTNSRPSV